MSPPTSAPALAFGLALGLSLPLVGCFTPPVVALAHDDSWTLETSGYPQDARRVEIRRGAQDGSDRTLGPTLRGLFFPSDEGAPVVVHFAESGASLTASIRSREQYHALAELGFASLAVDYRGVGLSDGDPSPRKLGEDAMAIWEEGLSLVDGDADRLVVRGASLGTVAISSLLAEGIEPAACIAFAPVRPKTVGRLYGYAVYWSPLVWLVAPLFRTFSDGDPLEWFTKPGVPRLVTIHPEDELLSERDFERLKLGVESSGGVVQVPEPLSAVLVVGDSVMKALWKHIGLVQKSFFVGDTEREFLRDLFPGVPDLGARLARIEKFGPPQAVAEVGSDRAMRARLELPLLQHRLLPPNLALAAAHSLRDGEMEFFDDWLMTPDGRGAREVFRTRSFERLTELLDLDDAGGRLPIEVIAVAARVLGADLDAGGARRWNHDRIEALMVSLAGFAIAGRTLPEDGQVLGKDEDWRFGVAEEDRVQYAEPGRSGWIDLQGLRKVHAVDAEGRSEAEAWRRLQRCFLKAAGLEESRTRIPERG